MHDLMFPVFIIIIDCFMSSSIIYIVVSWHAMGPFHQDSKSCKNSFSCHFKGQIQITMKFCTCIACNTVCEYKRLSWSKTYLNYGIQKLWYISDFKKKSFCEAAPWIHSLSQNNFRLLCLVSLKLQHYWLCKYMQMGVIIKCLYQACPVCGLYHANISLHK